MDRVRKVKNKHLSGCEMTRPQVIISMRVNQVGPPAVAGGVRNAMQGHVAGKLAFREEKAGDSCSSGSMMAMNTNKHLVVAVGAGEVAIALVRFATAAATRMCLVPV